MKYKDILWIYNQKTFKYLVNSYSYNMLIELRKDFTVLDYKDFDFVYSNFNKIIFLTRSLQKILSVENKCLDMFFEEFLKKSPENKIIIYIEDYLDTLNFDYSKIKFLIEKYKKKISVIFSIYNIKNFKSIKMINIPFFIPDYKINIFNKKKFDFIIWGKLNNEHYPLRKKISSFLMSKRRNISIKKLEHPGYEITNKKHDIVGEKLYKLLSNFWFSLCTCEKENYNSSFIPRKYLECMLNGSIPVGDYPEFLNIHTSTNIKMLDVEKIKINNLCNILNIMLRNKINLKNIIKYNYDIAKNFTFDKQNEYFYRLILTL